jgi:hypothetical protein
MCGDRLVRAFSSESQIEFLAETGFAGLRESICECSQIDVHTANHRNPG